jgi:MFS family permease
VITAVTASASVFAPSLWTFAALRFAFGFALPLDNIVIVWLLELLPSKLRGVLVRLSPPP